MTNDDNPHLNRTLAQLDDKTLLLPERRGNNRIDSLRNIMADPRVALLLLTPGVNETMRGNGRASRSDGSRLL